MQVPSEPTPVRDGSRRSFLKRTAVAAMAVPGAILATPTAGLTTVEARHAAFLNSLLGEALVPSFAPVESPIPQTVTLSRVATFIANLNAPPPRFLLLEYVESAFYQVNVTRFFRGSRPKGRGAQPVSVPRPDARGSRPRSVSRARRDRFASGGRLPTGTP